jgi:flagellar basal-body rod protein FlgB
MPALGHALTFGEARLRVIAENVANIGTGGYRAKQLDKGGFQAAMREALDRRGQNVSQPLEIRDTGEVSTDRQGRLVVKPSLRPAENVLFHDGTNMSIESQMSELAETQMMHRSAALLMRNRVDGLRKAIAGRV